MHQIHRSHLQGPYTLEGERKYIYKQLPYKVESNTYHTENEDEDINRVKTGSNACFPVL